MSDWSRWVFVVVPRMERPRPAAVIRGNVAKFGKSLFGPSFTAKVAVYLDRSMVFDVRAKGHPVTDPNFVTHVTSIWRQWATNGWGAGTEVQCAVAAPCEAPGGPLSSATRVSVSRSSARPSQQMRGL